MADKISIEIAGQVIDLPKWSTDENLSELIKIDKAALATLNALLKDNKTYSNQTIRSNESLLRGLSKQVSKGTTAATQNDEKIIRKLGDLFDREKLGQSLRNKQARAQEDLLDDLKGQAKKFNDNIKNVGKDVAQGINKTDLTGIATAMGSILGLGTAAGFAAGIFEGFAKNLSELNNIGVGLSTGLMDLRRDAAGAGLDLASYGKIIGGNISAIRALGSTTDEGARRFSNLSNVLRRQASDFGQFGLTNTEYNELLADEIELRRRGGMNEAQIAASVADSMNDLMLETTALASATGQDRREMLRNRQELLSDPVIAAAQQQLALQGEGISENIGSLGSILGGLGDGAKVFAGALGQAAVTDIPFFSTALGSSLSEMISIGGPQVTSAFQEIANFVDTNAMTMDPEQFNNQLTAMVGSLGDSMTPEARASLMNLAATGDASASQLLTFMQELEGIARTEQEVANARADTETGARANKGMLGLSSTLEDFTNNIKASALDDVLSRFGANIQDGGDNLVEALRGMSEDLEGKTLSEALGVDIFALGAGLAALGVGVKLAGAALAGGGIFALLRGGAGAGAGLLGRLFGVGAAAAPAAAGTATAGTAAAGTAATGGLIKSLARKAPLLAALFGVVDVGAAALDPTTSGDEKAINVGEATGSAVGMGVGTYGGMATGAAAGAAIGSFVPLIGTAIGGIAGSVIGGVMGAYGGGVVGGEIGESVTRLAVEDDIEAATRQIQEQQERIANSLAGQNEYLGNEQSGREDSAREILELQNQLQEMRQEVESNTTTVTRVTGNLSRMDWVQADEASYTEYLDRLNELISNGMDASDAERQALMEFADTINDLNVGDIVVEEIQEPIDQEALEEINSAIQANLDAVNAAREVLKILTPEQIDELSAQKSSILDQLDSYIFDREGNLKQLSDEDQQRVTELHERLDSIDQQFANQDSEYLENNPDRREANINRRSVDQQNNLDNVSIDEMTQLASRAVMGDESAAAVLSALDDIRSMEAPTEEDYTQHLLRNLQNLEAIPLEVDTSKVAEAQLEMAHKDFAEWFESAKTDPTRERDVFEGVDYGPLISYTEMVAQKKAIAEKYDHVAYGEPEQENSPNSLVIGGGDFYIPGLVEALEKTPEEPEATKVPDPAMQSSTILGYHDKLLRNAKLTSDALSNFEKNAGEKEVIGTEFDPLEGRDVDVLGYADAELQKQYKDLQQEKNSSNRQLTKLESTLKYKNARARELATEMGMKIGENIKFTSEGHVPTEINGTQVDQSLLTDRELEKIGVAQQMRDVFNGTPRRSSAVTSDNNNDSTTDQAKNNTASNNNTGQSEIASLSERPMTRAQGDLLIRTLQENNRLLRKGNDTAEMNS